VAVSTRSNRKTGAPSTALVALGGHAFMRQGESGTHEEHRRNARAICRQLMTLVERDYHLVITHGNGPQVGALLERNELAHDRLPPKPLDVLVAQTEGSLGYYLQQELLNELRRRGRRRFVVTVVTQVVVDPDDDAFAAPSKPIGPFLSREEAEARRDSEGWIIGEDAGRGWRRLVPSPRPTKVIQHAMIRQAVAQGHIVIACGGGGIPVVRAAEGGDYVGVEAVIDKDLTSGLLAQQMGAELFIILTAVDRVYLSFGTPQQAPLGAVTLAECQRYIAEGHFPPGSMGPKVSAVHAFLERGGRRALITSPQHLAAALDGAAGTHFVGKI
jgi:carbamate kinase